MFWHVWRDFPAFRATRNFSIFIQELVIFTITGISICLFKTCFDNNEIAHTLPAYPVKMGSFTVFAHIFLKFFRRSRATFWGLAGTFGPRATGWEPLLYTIPQHTIYYNYLFLFVIIHSIWNSPTKVSSQQLCPTLAMLDCTPLYADYLYLWLTHDYAKQSPHAANGRTISAGFDTF